MRKYYFWKNSALWILFIAIIFTQPTAAFATNSIIAFGDSITEGYGDTRKPAGYETDLEKLTDAINNYHDVLNFGLGGERTTNTERYPYPEGGIHRLTERVLPAAPPAKYILIMEGTNDYWDGITSGATIDNLRYMITKAREAGLEPIIGTLTPDTRFYAQDKNILELNSLIRKMAEEEDVVVADFYPQMIEDWEAVYAGCPFPEYLGEPDMVHPCRQGYEKMAEIWFEALNLPVIGLPFTWLNLLLK